MHRIVPSISKEKVFLGIAPIGWTNDDMPDLGKENTFEQAVSEMALAGFKGSEVGSHYPTDADTLKKALDFRGLTICNQWFSSFLISRPYEETEAAFIKQLDFLSIVCIKGVLCVSAVAMGVLAFSDSWAVTAAIIVMYGCYGGIMGSFPSLTSNIFGIEHFGENYGYVMFGIVIATFAAPVITEFVVAQGSGMKAVFALGMLFEAVAFVCLWMMGRTLNNTGKKIVKVCE